MKQHFEFRSVVFSTEMKAIASFWIVIAAALAEQVRYDGFKVYRLTPKTVEAAEALRDLERSDGSYDFWSGIAGVGVPVDIMVPPHYKYRFEDVLRSGLFESELFIADVQKLIDAERPKSKSAGTRAMEWSDYHSLDEINNWLETLDETYSEISLFEAGESYEGRKIQGVTLSYSPENYNRTVFIESNIHAREWITSATTTWILNEFLTSDDPQVRNLAESYDWIFVPVFNPDGFEYSHTTDRLWRKTRTPYFLCIGVDPNRNWNYHYNDGGSSADPCSNTYRGPEAFSEKSTRTISEYIGTVATRLVAYLAVHSYGQLLLLPYGYTGDHLDNYDELYSAGLKAAEDLTQKHGTNYTVGNTVEVLYVASGISMDWVKGTFGTRITYTYELRDTGEYGFILPPEQIVPTAEETLISLITLFAEFEKLDSGQS